MPWSVRVWWVGAALVLAVVGWFKSINLLLLLGYVLLALVGINAWVAWRSAWRLTATRRPSAPVFPSEAVVVTAEVANPSARPVTALVAERSGWNRAAWFLTPLGAGGSRTLTTRWTFSTRGRHRVEPLTAEVSYPFGLVYASRDLTGPGEVVVLPAVGRVDLPGFRRWLARGASGESHTRRPSRRAAPGTGDVRGLRPYRIGDSPRDIHWKSSARRNQLLVREYDRGDPVGLVIVIDPWIPAGPTRPEAGRRLEWALSLATTLGQAWCDSDDGSGLTLIVPGTPPVIRSGRGTPGFVRQAFVPLADLAGTHVVPAAVPSQARRSNRAARVVVSTRPSSPLADALRSAGLPCVVVDPTAAPHWFVPPEELKT
ncbi:MAG TPA: DUF58 domain-containing protein [Fimbriiglobus sp.]|nr:DUF58 domain-containing protein [Fimbriiglobus sp.]